MLPHRPADIRVAALSTRRRVRSKLMNIDFTGTGLRFKQASNCGHVSGTVFVDQNGYMINVYWTNTGEYGDNGSCMEPEAAQAPTDRTP